MSMSMSHDGEPMSMRPRPPPGRFFGRGRPTLRRKLHSCGATCGRACASLPELELHVPDAPPRVIAVATSCMAIASIATASAGRVVEGARAAAAKARAAVLDVKGVRPRELAGRAASAAMTAGARAALAGRSLAAQCSPSASTSALAEDDDDDDDDGDDDGGKKGGLAGLFSGWGGGGGKQRQRRRNRNEDDDEDDEGMSRRGGKLVRPGRRGGQQVVVVGGLRFNSLEIKLLLGLVLVACLLVISNSRRSGGFLRDDEWGSELEELARARRVNRWHGGGRGGRFGGWGGGGGGGAVVGHRLGGGGGGGGGGGDGSYAAASSADYDGPESTGRFSAGRGGWGGGWGGRGGGGGGGRGGGWGGGGGNGNGNGNNVLRGGPLVDQGSLEELLKEHSRTTPSDGRTGLDGKFFDRKVGLLPSLPGFRFGYMTWTMPAVINRTVF
jgi:hypothetical protein